MDVTLGQRQEDARNCWPANQVKSVSFSSVRNFVLKKEVEHSKGRHRTLVSSYNMHTCVYTHSHTGVYIYNKLSHMFTRYSANTWLLIAPFLWCDLDVWLVSVFAYGAAQPQSDGGGLITWFLSTHQRYIPNTCNELSTFYECETEQWEGCNP